MNDERQTELPTMIDRETVRRILCEHRWSAVPSSIGLCSCGRLPSSLENFGFWVEAWREHLIDELLAVLT